MISAPSSKTTICLTILLLVLLCASQATAKTAIDFNPNLDFSQFKTFAYIGGVEQLLKLQLNPDLLNNRIHRAVIRELTAKGLREVKPEENPDLVVRYWVNGQETDINVSNHANWGIYGTYYGYHWGYIYYSMNTTTSHLGTLGIELIDPKSRDLAWRMFASAKLYHNDDEKIWKTADSNIKKAFKSYPPSAKDIETTKARWAKEDAAPKTGQP
ncbi:MAG TPA: DUF4136 domain-containing protein [Candidatus Acidoferrum sp.]